VRSVRPYDGLRRPGRRTSRRRHDTERVARGFMVVHALDEQQTEGKSQLSFLWRSGSSGLVLEFSTSIYSYNNSFLREIATLVRERRTLTMLV
jgi:hypothetical protein